jgi:hypothetical protein
MIAPYNTEDLQLSIGGVKIEPMRSSDIHTDYCRECGQETDYGCHGIRDGLVFSEYLCRKHYLERK